MRHSEPRGSFRPSFRMPASLALPSGSVAHFGTAQGSEGDAASVRQRFSQAKVRVVTRLGLLVALILLVATVGLATLRIVYADSVYPGVKVAGVSVSGMDRSSAELALEAKMAPFEQGMVAFSVGSRTWTPTLAELGVRFDIETSLAAAYALGRESSASDRALSTVQLLRNGSTVPVVAVVDQQRLSQWFSQVDRELDQPAAEPSLTIEGSAVIFKPGSSGTVIDRARATETILSAVTALQPVATELPIVSWAPQLSATDFAVVQSRLEAALAAPITVNLEDQSWTITPEELAPFLQVTVDPSMADGQKVTTDLDERALTAWLRDRFAAVVDRDAVDAVVSWNDRLVALEPSVTGIKLRPATFATSVATSFWGSHQAVEIPVSRVAPAVDSSNLDALGITTKLATGDSNYEGSNADRATNIAVGAQLLNGTLVAPGAEFSFNHAVGVIDAEKGFVDAQVINGERIGRDIGGGICQVSTTVYRAALFAGLPITEWWPHRYRLGFYEQDDWQPGFDASILQPNGDPFSGGDFKFQNPSEDSWLLVESWSDGGRIYVILYGPDFGYSVDISNPAISEPLPPTEDIEVVDASLPPGSVAQTEAERSGLEVSFDRVVTDRDGNEVRADTWFTRFEPSGNVWTVSEDMAGQSPAST